MRHSPSGTNRHRKYANLRQGGSPLSQARNGYREACLQYSVANEDFASCVTGSANPDRVSQWCDWLEEPMDESLVAEVQRDSQADSQLDLRRRSSREQRRLNERRMVIRAQQREFRVSTFSRKFPASDEILHHDQSCRRSPRRSVCSVGRPRKLDHLCRRTRLRRGRDFRPWARKRSTPKRSARCSTKRT